MFCKRVSLGLLKLLDALILRPEQNPGFADPRDLEGDVKLAKLIPLKVLEDNANDLSARQIIEVLLNGFTEYNDVVYFKHVYGQAVAYALVGDNTVISDRTLPIMDRVNVFIKRVQKMGVKGGMGAVKGAGVAGVGKKKGGDWGGKGGRKRGQQWYQNL